MERETTEVPVEEDVTIKEFLQWAGLSKSKANGQSAWTIDINGGLVTVIKDMILNHENFKKQRLGLKPESNIIIPKMNPFKNG